MDISRPLLSTLAKANCIRRAGITLAALCLLMGGFVAIGCEKKLDPQEYGQIVEGQPKIEGTEKPYPLPLLEDADKKPRNP